MRHSRALAALTVAGLAVLAPATTATAGTDTGSAAGTRQEAYRAAAAEYGVPLSVLLGVSYLESRWDTHDGAPSTDGGFGPMHLTDAPYMDSLPEPTADEEAAPEDARGDESRPLNLGPRSTQDQPSPESLRTLERAAELTGLSAESLRTDPVANLRGGAALLADYQKSVTGTTGDNAATWYGAVARYSGADDADTASQFADQVYATINSGADRVTDDGQQVSLAASPVAPDRSLVEPLRLAHKPRGEAECPVDLACQWVQAPYQDIGGGDYGNYDLADRPHDEKIEYIVIHDTEASWATTLKLVQDPTYLGWHYSLRSVDGMVANHIHTKNVGWHAGNWYVNAKSIGIEHEGYAAKGSWYTEAMYRSSAKLVRYLALRYDIPLDRQHIIGHDNVPGTTTSTVRGMHWDPGPYWDWGHYFDLLKAPLQAHGNDSSGLVTINPDYATNQPAFTGCTGASTNPCPQHGSTEVILRQAPSATAPLVLDEGLHPNHAKSTMVISDHSARASTGQTYAVAERQGDWTAIWYLGQKSWFYNPATAPTALNEHGFVVTPKAGRSGVPIYGRAYPEATAYPAGVPYQTISAYAQYQLLAGQRYTVGGVVNGEYYRAVTFDGSSPGDWTVIRGENRYVQIQFGHRIMFVNYDDVDIVPSQQD